MAYLETQIETKKAQADAQDQFNSDIRMCIIIIDNFIIRNFEFIILLFNYINLKFYDLEL